MRDRDMSNTAQLRRAQRLSLECLQARANAREHTEALVSVCLRILEKDTLAGMRQKMRDAISAIEGEGDANTDN